MSLDARLQLAAIERRLFDATSDPVHIGRFVVLAQLGAGAMGTVYAAFDSQLDRKVAIKLLKHIGAEATERLVREAKALAQLNHPNVVAIHEIGEDDGGVFVAMEHVDGGTLADWCAARPRPSAMSPSMA